VASVTNTDAKSSFSNFGPEVDLAAGGTDIRSLVGTSTYGFKSGTSQATPSVTGTIALMLAWNPTLSAGEVRDILTGTAVDIGAPGFDPITGFGRVNAHAALLATPNPLPADLNNDGSVGPNDLAILLDFWGACADCDGACVADLDGDCLVGPTDLAILLGSWG
jgi:subtilisin family serine protease